MPELPDIVVYVECLGQRVLGRELRSVRPLNPFVLRTAVPPITEAAGRVVKGVERLGKRIVLSLQDDDHLVVHLMVAGRLRWLEAATRAPPRGAIAVFEFETGRLALTEAGTRRRASLHFVRGRHALAAMDRGGIDVLAIDCDTFATRLRAENHTLKRALTEPRLFSGIGNAYSDEILHAARLSPVALTARLEDDEVTRLFHAARATLLNWTQRLRADTGRDWPRTVTAFREGMAVHGRFGKPCPVCGAPVQRIVFAENQTNYCARCQTGGKILADRALSRLLKASWPRNVDELG